MTAEIAIMNMNSIALAADSCVTTNGGEENLFELSSHHPVGIMVYGKSDYLRAPWETLIKTYRNKLKDKHFDTLEQYVADFLSFVDNSNYEDLPSDEAEAQFAFDSLNHEVKRLASQLSKANRDLTLKLRESHTENEISTEYFERGEVFIEDKLNVLEKEYINEFTHSDFSVLTKKFDEHIDQMLSNYFNESLLKETWRGKIKTIVCSNVLKTFFNYSGIVFAGFGERELFPSVITVKIEGKINGKLKYAASSKLSKNVNPENPVYIIPFDQADTVRTLITGIDDRIEDFSLTKLETMLGTMENKLIDKLKDNFKEDVNLAEVKSVIHDELAENYLNYNQDVYEFKQTEYVKPITDTVKLLRKKQMGEMAESFINLTSFKQKASSTMETVDSSVDVAVITKGDGFEWVKKKDN